MAGSILGVDYGERRLGLAVSDPDAIFAMPLRVANVASEDDRVEAVRAACEESEVDRVIVGLPLNMDGSAGPMAEKALNFVEALKAVLAVPVDTWDERLSSIQAERTMLEADLSRGKRRRTRDKLAAQIILQGYLDSRVMRAD